MQQCNLIDGVTLGQSGLCWVTLGHYKESLPQNTVKSNKISESMLNAISSKHNFQSVIALRCFPCHSYKWLFSLLVSKVRHNDTFYPPT